MTIDDAVQVIKHGATGIVLSDKTTLHKEGDGWMVKTQHRSGPGEKHVDQFFINLADAVAYIQSHRAPGVTVKAIKFD